MEQTVVKANPNREKGSRPSRRLRADGQLPGVVYGQGKDPISVSVEYRALRDALKTDKGLNTVIQLDLGDATETVLVRDVQRDPIKRLVIHADFMRVHPDSPVRVEVPIRAVGDASSVTSEGANVEQKMFSIAVEARPDAIPDAIEADLGMLELDRRIAVGDLFFPEGVTTRVPLNISVVVPVVSRAAKVALREGEEAEGEAVDEAENQE